MTLQTLQQRTQSFVSWLESRQEDRAVMAELRRGFSPGTEHYAWKHLAQWFDLENSRLRTIYTIVAACYALHPQNTEKGNLGTTLRQIITSMAGPGNDVLESHEGRLRRLLGCTRAVDVCHSLRQVIALAKQHSVPVNYAQLLRDLLDWDWSSKKVKVAWVREYWKQKEEHSDDALSNTNQN